MKQLSNKIPGEPFLIQIDNLLSLDECQYLINLADNVKTNNLGNKAWHTSTTNGYYDRVIFKDRKLSNVLYDRIKHLLPAEYKDCKIVYLNDVFRFSRYINGGEFEIHKDGTNFDMYRSDEYPTWVQPQSIFTLNIFLNDNFQGGETDFFNSRNRNDLRYSVKPAAGRAALFYAKQWHSGNKVYFDTLKGETHKYLLRTDVMCIENSVLVQVKKEKS